MVILQNQIGRDQLVSHGLSARLAKQVKVERSRDAAVIRAICTHPEIFPHVTDDFFPSPEAWTVPDLEHFHFFVAIDDVGVCGFGAFHPRNFACWEAHCGFLVRAYGQVAITAIRQMLDLMLERVPRIVGEIPISNRRAIAFAKRAGLVEYGINRKSTLRGGQLIDQVCLGLSKG